MVVVDPPRAGLSKKVVRRVIECGAQRIVYVSCNPTTLAPNAAQLAEAGYTLRRVRPVDMFPQTPHVECVALLERSSEPMSRGFGVAAGLDPEVARPLAAALRGAGLHVDVVERPPGRPRARDPGGLRRGGARGSTSGWR